MTSPEWRKEAERLITNYGASVMGRYRGGYWQSAGQQRCDDARAALLAHLDTAPAQSASPCGCDRALLRQCLEALESVHTGEYPGDIVPVAIANLHRQLKDQPPTNQQENAMTLTPEQQEQFEALARPLIAWINENGNPHMHVVITTTSAEMSEGVASLYTEQYIRG